MILARGEGRGSAASERHAHHGAVARVRPIDVRRVDHNAQRFTLARSEGRGRATGKRYAHHRAKSSRPINTSGVNRNGYWIVLARRCSRRWPSKSGCAGCSIHVQRQIGVLDAQEDIKSKVQEELGERQRELYLREQLKAIQKELGEEDEAGRRDRLRERSPRWRCPPRSAQRGATASSAASTAPRRESMEAQVIRT